MTDYQPLLFVDTNALHFARLYLDFAKEQGLPPLTTSTKDPDTEIRDIHRGRTQGNYIKGRKLVDFLIDRCNQGAVIEYSPVTHLELTCGLLRGKAMLDAAGEGVANRMWNRMDEREILERLQPEDHNDVKSGVAGLEDQFQEAGVDLVETKPDRMSAVWTLATQVLEFVFLDVGDCAIYASALLAEADELVTDDRYLRDIVGYIENPYAAPPPLRTRFIAANSEIKALLANRYIGVDISKIKVPTARKDW